MYSNQRNILAEETLLLFTKARNELFLLIFSSYELNFVGELIKRNKTVAMKITPEMVIELFNMNEYEYYSYMNAINDTTAENYGIPTVYYFGSWEKYSMLAITLLGSSVDKQIHKPGFKTTDVDYFIMFREYVSIITKKCDWSVQYQLFSGVKVRISKYIHSCGVCQDDVHLRNMVFQKHQVFLIGQ